MAGVAARKPAHRNRVINGRAVTTETWRALRQRWQERLPQPCPRCGIDVQPWDPWDLDHVGEPVALGGRTTDIRPAHRACNQRAGGELTQALASLGASVARGATPNFSMPEFQAG